MWSRVREGPDHCILRDGIEIISPRSRDSRGVGVQSIQQGIVKAIVGDETQGPSMIVSDEKPFEMKVGGRSSSAKIHHVIS